MKEEREGVRRRERERDRQRKEPNQIHLPFSFGHFVLCLTQDSFPKHFELEQKRTHRASDELIKLSRNGYRVPFFVIFYEKSEAH